MTDGATDDDSGGGRLELGPAADELFADVETGSPDDRDERAVDDGVEDRTAADVFGQLRADVDAAGADDVLDGETPEEIIASADDPDPEPEVDDDLLADEGELEALLLTGRVEGEEFLWIDTDADDASEDLADDADEDTASEDLADEDAPDDPDRSGSGGLVIASVDGNATGDEAGSRDEDAGGSDGPSGVVGRLRSKLPF